MLHTSQSNPEVDEALHACRSASAAWASTAVSTRVAVIREARYSMALNAAVLAATVTRRPVRDTLVCEVLPLLDAMRFLERRARGLLATKRLRRGRPLWLMGVSAEIHREPLGVVLILGPGNYPLFLPCVQVMQAIVAGNTVCLKPAPGGEGAATAVASHLYQAGLPADVLRLLEVGAGPDATASPFDHIVLTGAAATGIKVMKAAASRLTPVTMELSGCDAVYVLPGADMTRLSRCLIYGLALNGGATCIAPRRVFVLKRQAAELEAALLRLLPTIPTATIAQPIAELLTGLLDQAARAGADVHCAGAGRPILIANARSSMALLQRDVFAPWLALVPVADMEEALTASKVCPYALGASIFGPPSVARRFATRIHAGSVCINDVIMPTADPRLPFGGNGRSGFGRTRGAEGLLGMTNSKSVSVRHGRFMPHLSGSQVTDEARFSMLIRWLHKRWPWQHHAKK